MNAPTLFDAVAAYHHADPAQSVEAAHRPRGWLRRQALLVLADATGGLTGNELWAAGVGSQPASAGQRLADLAVMGYAERSGGTRPTPSGGRAAVFTITETGRHVAAESMGETK